MCASPCLLVCVCMHVQELARYVNTEQVVRDAVECPTPLDGLGLATPVPPPRAAPIPAASADSAPEVEAAVV